MYCSFQARWDSYSWRRDPRKDVQQQVTAAKLKAKLRVFTVVSASLKSCLSTRAWKPSMHFSTAPLCFIWQSKSTKSCPDEMMARSEISRSPPSSTEECDIQFKICREFINSSRVLCCKADKWEYFEAQIITKTMEERFMTLEEHFNPYIVLTVMARGRSPSKGIHLAMIPTTRPASFRESQQALVRSCRAGAKSSADSEPGISSTASWMGLTSSAPEANIFTVSSNTDKS